MSMYVVGNPFFFPTNGHLGWELDDHNYSPVGSRGVFYFISSFSIKIESFLIFNRLSLSSNLIDKDKESLLL